MKKQFDRLPLPIKLLLIGFVPLAFSFFLAFKHYQDRDDRIRMLDTQKQFIGSVERLAELGDELLLERRAAFSFEMERISEQEYLTRQNLTDEAIHRLDRAQSGLLGDYKRYTMLNTLPDFRESIMKDSIPENWVLQYYTLIINRINLLMARKAENLQSIDPVLNRAVTSSNLLSQLAMQLGTVRSNVYFALEKKEVTLSFMESLKRQWLDYRAMELELLSEGDSATAADYRNVLKSDYASEVYTTMKDIEATGSILLSTPSETWWNLSKNMTEDIRDLRRNAAENIAQKVNGFYDSEVKAKNLNLALIIIMILLVLMLIYLSVKSISNSLNNLSDVSRRLAKGELGLEIPVHTNDVIGHLAESIQAIDTNKRKLAIAAEEIGKGNFTTPIEVRGDKDVIGLAISRMKQNLINFSQDQENKMWLSESTQKMGAYLQGELTPQQIGERALGVLSETIGLEVGVMYASRMDTYLELSASYAVSDPTQLPQKLQRGQSLAGQAFADKQQVVLDHIDPGYMQINSSTLQSPPTQLVIIPLIHEDRVEGVLELGKRIPFTQLQLQLLKEISPRIAISLQTAKSRMRLQELLEETQAQSEELQTQHSELENLNAELESQTQKLQTSEEELRVQQEELQQANAELEERTRLLEEKNQEIAHRTIEIQNKAEQLEASTRYKSEFLANMSHELRTPLNSILLLSRLLKENTPGNLSNDQVEYAKVISQSGQGLLSLIDEILDLSKIEAGKMTVEVEPFTVKELFDTINGLFELQVKEKALQWKMEIDPGTPEMIHSDRMKLEQILRNLLSNALKFTKNGFISLSAKPDGENRISLTVRDTGIGIANDKLDLVFEAFQQEDGSTRRRFGGTGLGLSISRELTRLLGGEISVDSEQGKGSSFTVTLPVKFNEALPGKPNHNPPPSKVDISVADQDPFIAESIPENVEDDRNNITPNDNCILIIEDDVGFAKSLLKYTHNKGYKALVATRGDMGIQLAKKYKPIGILLDIQLPVKSGWEVIEALKNDPSTRHIPVHIMSSYEVKKESLLKGAINFIQKPVAPDQINDVFKRIEHIINKESQKVIILEENPKHAKALAYFLESFRINTDIKHSIESGVEALKAEADCVVLDMGIPTAQTYELLEKIKKKEGLENLPVIVFTGKSLSEQEEQRIRKYADSIVMKTAQSYQRILSEVTLFLHMVEQQAADGKGRTSQKFRALNNILKNKKVLIVDDDVRNIFSLSKALEPMQIQVYTATDGKEAMDILKDNPDMHLVLLDMMMPEMDGYETARSIRKIPEFRKLPVIAVTAKAMTGDREKCIAAGASDYITKPVDTDQLLSLLRVWLYENNY